MMKKLLQVLILSAGIFSLVSCSASLELLDEIKMWNYTTRGQELAQGLGIFGIYNDQSESLALDLIFGDDDNSSERMEIIIDADSTYIVHLASDNNYSSIIVPLSFGDHTIKVGYYDYDSFENKTEQFDLKYVAGQVVSLILVRGDDGYFINVIRNEGSESEQLISALYGEDRPVKNGGRYLYNVIEIIMSGEMLETR